MLLNNHLLRKIIQLCQEQKRIVYHGSGQTGLDFIDSFSPGYEGGLGSGVYCDFDREVAKFYSYSGSVYVLELLLSDDQILYITPDENLVHFDNELSSMLIGENVVPFMFYIGEEKYYVCDDYSWDQIIKDSVINHLLKTEKEIVPYLNEDKLEIDDDKIYDSVEKNIKEQLSEQQKNQLEKAEKEYYNNSQDEQMSYEDWLFTKPELIKYYEDLIHQETNRLFDIYYDKLQEAIKLIESQFDSNNRIELEEIGTIAKQHGYKAVYVEGIRNNFPDSELLVFDPSDLKFIREEKP